MTAGNRQVVTRAADAIDQELRHEPANVGESRSETERVLFHPPLVAAFEVHEGDSLVKVLRALNRVDWLRTLAPTVSISPVQMLKAKTPRRRASKKKTKKPS